MQATMQAMRGDVVWFQIYIYCILGNCAEVMDDFLTREKAFLA